MGKSAGLRLVPTVLVLSIRVSASALFSFPIQWGDALIVPSFSYSGLPRSWMDSPDSFWMTFGTAQNLATS
ncbi:hypothetical protein OG21DRAFT_1508120 [Imleria badia]|nr:hypothetical protein OG21DRAFT_1508120 [Imleria badia]